MKPEQGAIFAAFAATIVMIAAKNRWIQKFIAWVPSAPKQASDAQRAAEAQQGAQVARQYDINGNPTTQGIDPNVPAGLQR